MRGENENTWARLREPRALMLLSRNLDMLLGSSQASQITFYIVGQKERALIGRRDLFNDETSAESVILTLRRFIHKDSWLDFRCLPTHGKLNFELLLGVKIKGHC